VVQAPGERTAVGVDAEAEKRQQGGRRAGELPAT